MTRCPNSTQRLFPRAPLRTKTTATPTLGLIRLAMLPARGPQPARLTLPRRCRAPPLPKSTPAWASRWEARLPPRSTTTERRIASTTPMGSWVWEQAPPARATTYAGYSATTELAGDRSREEEVFRYRRMAKWWEWYGTCTISVFPVHFFW